MVDSSTNCPKCQQRREADWTECPFCGVIYAKAEGRPGGAAIRFTAAAPLGLPAPPVPAYAGGGAAALPDMWPGDSVDPYRPPTTSPTLFVTTRGSGVRLAGRGSRLVAQLVDSFVAMALAAAFLVPWLLTADTATMAADPADPDALAGAMLGVLAIPMLILLAVQLYLLYRDGQTVGKKVAKVRIVKDDGDRAGLWRILLLRYLVPGLLGAVPLVGGVFSLVDILFIFREDRRCIHDHVASTKVVEA